ncbi:AMP-binding protein [Natrinema gelatinilyticum]|uniref:AMP-binding protein n=1 Tax=Natrinema gelatinilyticum TaxID=2961571 RepID=UPI0020C4B5E5|nr:class I adenylate-forming enzyme family protein [Natrinema gelatinilyticum]
MTNVLNTLEERASTRPDAIAVDDGDRTVTYRELWTLTDWFAGGLRRRGVADGDAVAVHAPPSVDGLIACYGALRNGSVVVPVPEHLLTDAVAICRDCDVRAVVSIADRLSAFVTARFEQSIAVRIAIDDDPLLAASMADVLEGDDLSSAIGRDRGSGIMSFGASRHDTAQTVVARRDADAALLAYVSRAGELVATPISHGVIRASIEIFDALVPRRLATTDVHLGALPITTVSGLILTAHATLSTGGTYAPLPRWDPDRILELLADRGITIAALRSDQLADLLDAVDSATDSSSGSCRTIAIVGPTPDEGRCEQLRAWPSVDSIHVAGYVETGSVAFGTRSSDALVAGSLGTAIGPMRVRVVDETFAPVPPVPRWAIRDPPDDAVGRVLVTGPTLSTGYREPSTAVENRFVELDGHRWFEIDDPGYRTEDGYVFTV